MALGPVGFWCVPDSDYEYALLTYASPQQPGFSSYLDLLDDSSRSTLHVPIYQQPMYLHLQEHHCLHPSDPLPISIDDTSFDDILHAWLPRGLDLRRLEVSFPHKASSFHSALVWADCKDRGLSAANLPLSSLAGSHRSVQPSIRKLHPIRDIRTP